MWSPTHIQVTVQRAKGLLTKGKNGTNNCFVTIALGKEKYQTSVIEKSVGDVEWHEECELMIPDRGNRAELILTCLHRNNFGMDEFLGQANLPLNEMDVYDSPRSKWLQLQSKTGKENKKERGKLEVRICFIVKSGLVKDLNKKEKHKSSVGQLASSVGGSLLSLGTIEKRKTLKKFAKSLGSKMHISGKSKKNKDYDAESYTESVASTSTPNSHDRRRFGQRGVDADPGVVSEDEDEFVFDNLSHKSSGSSLNIKSHRNLEPSPILSSNDSRSFQWKVSPPSKPPRAPETRDEWEVKLLGKHADIDSSESLKRRSWENSFTNKLEQEDKSEQRVKTEQQNKIATENYSTKERSIHGPSETQTNPNDYQTNEMNSETTEVNSKNVKNIVPTQSSPNFTEVELNSEKKKVTNTPKALPRSNTVSCLIETSLQNDMEKREKGEKKRFTKLKYFRRDKSEPQLDNSFHKQFGERIIIGHENEFLKENSSQELSQAIIKKYEGKTREEVILIADRLENEVLVQKQRAKELEEYLDNLLLRVMESHPKILQNPLDRSTTTKSG